MVSSMSNLVVEETLDDNDSCDEKELHVSPIINKSPEIDENVCR